jgi:hypothetical protein
MPLPLMNGKGDSSADTAKIDRETLCGDHPEDLATPAALEQIVMRMLVKTSASR